MRLHAFVSRMGSEYGDEVNRSNMKEDMMLARRLRVLERQERIASNVIRKTIYEAERLSVCVRDHTCLAPDLKYYDMKKFGNKASRYGAMHGRRDPHSHQPGLVPTKTEKGERRLAFSLPPIQVQRTHRHDAQRENQQYKEGRMKTLPNIHHAHRAAMTMRQLRQKVASQEVVSEEVVHQRKQTETKHIKTMEWKERFLQNLEESKERKMRLLPADNVEYQHANMGTALCIGALWDNQIANHVM